MRTAGNAITIHKEQMLDDVERRYPVRCHDMVDNKLRILAAMKKVGGRLTTAFPRQGHYALDSRSSAAYPAAGVLIERIGDLANDTVVSTPRSDTKFRSMRESRETERLLS